VKDREGKKRGSWGWFPLSTKSESAVEPAGLDSKKRGGENSSDGQNQGKEENAPKGMWGPKVGFPPEENRGKVVSETVVPATAKNKKTARDKRNEQFQKKKGRPKWRCKKLPQRKLTRGFRTGGKAGLLRGKKKMRMLREENKP